MVQFRAVQSSSLDRTDVAKEPRRDMDFDKKTPTFENLKDMDYRGIFKRVTENQDINVWKDFIVFCGDFCRSSVEVMEDFMDKDKDTVEIEEMITDFVDFWAMARCWFKEKLGLTVDDEDDDEEEMEVDQVSAEDRGEEQTVRGVNKQERLKGVGVDGLLGVERIDGQEHDDGWGRISLDLKGVRSNRVVVKKRIGELGSNQQFENVEKVTDEEEGGKNRKPRCDFGVNKRELMEEEREVMPQQGEEPGGERQRESVGKGRRRMRGLHSRI